jgi:hypothetical protein
MTSQKRPGRQATWQAGSDTPPAPTTAVVLTHGGGRPLPVAGEHGDAAGTRMVEAPALPVASHA